MPGAESFSSPFDPVMIRFLQEIDNTPSGFLPGSQTRDIAATLEIPDGLVEALFVSARSRNLIQPDYLRRSRRAPWVVSARGRSFLKPKSTSDQPDGESSS